MKNMERVMSIGNAMKNVSVIAAALAVITIGSQVSTARADSLSDEKIDLGGVVDLNASAPGFGDSLGFGASALTDADDPLMTPHIIPSDSSSGQNPNPVPLPMSGGLGAVGLATLAMRRRRRSKLA